jgi:para-aminobenzoate synthetase / 4-amino-4-deoxychorismate lyase
LSISSVFKDVLGLGESGRGCHNADVFDRRRPDPALGVFETMLVVDGCPVELDAHLARLHASLTELFPECPPPNLDGVDVPSESSPYRHLSDGTSAAPRGGEQLGSMRITVAPGADGRLETRTEMRRSIVGSFFALPERDAPATSIPLHSLLVPGGFGAHKWADRSLLDDAQANLPADALALITDADGSVLEAARANVFAVRDGVLLTPPLDGRILPGVTRMRVLELAGVLGIESCEAGLSIDSLIAADEVFLTGSVRGIESVGSIDGEPLLRDGSVTPALASELRRLWLRAPVV